MREPFARAVEDGRVGDRLWLYATYHCNLACVYCLTESSPRIANRRTFEPEAMLAAVREARGLGFATLGVTGGEPFLLPWYPDFLEQAARELPTLTLTNATLFTERLLDRLEPLAASDVAFQVSLDSHLPDRNDGLRGPENFAKVIEAIPRLRGRGFRVRVATTVDNQTPAELERLCELHRSLGVPDEDHLVRPVVRRGRAALGGMGVELEGGGVLPELTLTADGAFLNPFGPTVRGGRTDIDLLVSRQVRPLEAALGRFLRVTADLPAGDDVVRNIR